MNKNHSLQYLRKDLKCDGSVMVFQRRNVIVANGKLCLCINLVTVDVSIEFNSIVSV